MVSARSKVIQSDSAVHLDLPAVRGVFDGTLNSIRNTISGTWQQNGNPSDLTFKRSDQILELASSANAQEAVSIQRGRTRLSRTLRPVFRSQER